MISRDIISSAFSRPSAVPRLISNWNWSIVPTRSIIATVFQSPLLAPMALQKPKSAFAKLDSENPPDYRARYKPFLLDEQTTSTDWISELVLDTVADLARQDLLTTAQPLRVLVLYGSLRKRYGCTIHLIAVVSRNTNL